MKQPSQLRGLPHPTNNPTARTTALTPNATARSGPIRGPAKGRSVRNERSLYAHVNHAYTGISPPSTKKITDTIIRAVG